MTSRRRYSEKAKMLKEEQFKRLTSYLPQDSDPSATLLEKREKIRQIGRDIEQKLKGR